MTELLENLMDLAAGEADYADVRHVVTTTERITTRNGGFEGVDRSEEEGVGVRVRLAGAWGFAATRGTNRPALEQALARALVIARAQPPAAPLPWLPEPPARGSHAAPVAQDPFAVPLEDKLAVLLAADDAMRGDPRVVLTTATFHALREQKTFASTDGALFRQDTVDCGGGIAASAASVDDLQQRSYPNSHDGSVAQAGYEHFCALDLAAHAPRVAEEAVALLSAPACPAQRTSVILDGGQMELQLHESVAHALELDRVLGEEASYAGTSWVPADALGSLRYGSELMNVTADATVPGGLGSFRWDDEGVEARATPLVRDGVVRGFLSSRESAARAGLERSGGCMRAEGFARQPIVRMTNVNLEPGRDGTLEDLIADTSRGIYMETNRSWSIDSRRLQFQFATEAAWEVVDGVRRRLLKNPSYAGVTPDFWAGLDGLCSASEWRLWSVLSCGKGEPGQLMRVSHGVAPARFRDVQVGVA